MRVDVCYTRDFRFFGCAGWVGCVLFCCRPTRFLWFGQVRHFFLGVIVVMMCVSLPQFFVSFFSFFFGVAIMTIGSHRWPMTHLTGCSPLAGAWNGHI